MLSLLVIIIIIIIIIIIWHAQGSKIIKHDTIKTFKQWAKKTNTENIHNKLECKNW